MRVRTAGLLHGDLTEKILGVFYDVHHEFGDGFLERLCQQALIIGLREAGLTVDENREFDVVFRGHHLGTFVPDMVINGLVLGEVKSVPSIEPRHIAQTINYLRVSPLEVGLLMNFGRTPQVERLIYTNDRKISFPGPMPK